MLNGVAAWKWFLFTMPNPKKIIISILFVCFIFFLCVCVEAFSPVKRCKVIGRSDENTNEKFTETVTQYDFIKITLKAETLSAMEKKRSTRITNSV